MKLNSYRLKKIITLDEDLLKGSDFFKTQNDGKMAFATLLHNITSKLENRPNNKCKSSRSP